MQGAVRYIYKFPSDCAFLNSQSMHIPGHHIVSAENLNDSLAIKYVNLTNVVELFCLEESTKFKTDKWIHSDSLFKNYAPEVEYKQRWPLYLASISSQNGFYFILHPFENERIQKWIAAINPQMEKLMDMIEWHPMFGSKPHKVAQNIDHKGSNEKKRKINDNKK